MRIEIVGRRPLLRRVTPVHRDHGGELVLDTHGLLFASPLDLAAMAALANTAEAQGASTTIITPDNPSTSSYLERMDVLARLPKGSRVQGSVPRQRRAPRADALLEVLPVSAASEQELVDRIGLIAFTHLDPAIRGLAFQSIGELIDNAVSHGTSELGAFAAAQVYTGATTGRRGMEFAICDTGIGILEHLRSNPENRDIQDEREALERALRPGVTGTQDKRGNGLADLFNVTEAGGYARLVLRSGNGLASIVARQHDQRRHYVTAADRITGTWAWLRVRYP
ncbi:hypothetical protein [Micromonospora aurantiaca (nom. illeg.)]|uniref:hypothetical protein n=1 Tax=Micromonospora aurantiaca (nom. illeg.) TaxID=47850 RepID=UPI0036586325